MANFISRLVATKNSAGQSGSARTNQAEELVAIPWIYQLALEGRIFIAGNGIEETEINGEASIDDTTPTIALVAPDSGTIVLPLYFRAYFDTEGGAAPDLKLAYVQESKSVRGSGTALTALNLLGGSSPRSAAATCEHTCSSVTAITNAQNVMFRERLQTLDNAISTEGATTVVGQESIGGDSTMEFLVRFEQEGLPFALYGGSSILFYQGTGTADSEWNFTWIWAELDSDIYAGKN